MSSRILPSLLSLTVLVVALVLLGGCAEFRIALAMSETERAQPANGRMQLQSSSTVMVCEVVGQKKYCRQQSMQDLREALSFARPGPATY